MESEQTKEALVIELCNLRRAMCELDTLQWQRQTVYEVAVAGVIRSARDVLQVAFPERERSG